MKFLNLVRISSFVLVLLTSIPLFVSYLRGAEPQWQLIVDLHVWLGVVFFVSAGIGMIRNKGK